MVLNTTQAAVHRGEAWRQRRLAAAQDTQAAAGVRLRAAQSAALLGGHYDPDELDRLIGAVRQARAAADAAFTAWYAGTMGAAGVGTRDRAAPSSHSGACPLVLASAWPSAKAQ